MGLIGLGSVVFRGAAILQGQPSLGIRPQTQARRAVGIKAKGPHSTLIQQHIT